MERVSILRIDSGGARCVAQAPDEGLAQEFNSLDAQREAAEAYIASQKHEGWTLVPDAYNDGGFTGANMDRPALRRACADLLTEAVPPPHAAAEERPLRTAAVRSRNRSWPRHQHSARNIGWPS